MIAELNVTSNVTSNVTMRSGCTDAELMRWISDGHRDPSALASCHLVQMVAIGQRYVSQVVGYAFRNFGSLVSTPQKRGFRPPDLRLRTKIRPGGYNQNPPRVQGIPRRHRRARDGHRLALQLNARDLRRG